MADNIKVLVKKTVMSTLASTYHLFTIADTVAGTLFNPPIVITDFSVDASQVLTIKYTFSSIHASDLYVTLD